MLQDPMVAYVSGIRERLDRSRRGPHKKLDAAASGLAKHGAKLCGTLISAAAKTLIPGSSEVFEAIGDLTGEIAKELLEFQAEHEKSQAEFRRLLSEARDILTQRVAEQKITPIVVMIDELDRCRPDFAVQALERVKHFFDVEGIVFLLATDAANLPAAISSVYGIKVDPERYLRKFIDSWYHLPDPEPEHFVRHLYFATGLADIAESRTLDDALAERGSPTKAYKTDKEDMSYACADVVSVFPHFAHMLGLSLRDQVQVFSMVASVLRCAPNRAAILADVLCLGACVRFLDREKFVSLRTGKTYLHKLISPANPEIGTTAFFSNNPVGVATKATATALVAGTRVERMNVFWAAIAGIANQGNSSALTKEIKLASYAFERSCEPTVLNVAAMLSITERFAPAR